MFTTDGKRKILVGFAPSRTTDKQKFADALLIKDVERVLGEDGFLNVIAHEATGIVTR